MFDETATLDNEISFQTANGQEFRANGGVQPFSQESVTFSATPAQNPSTPRWLFNPFAYIRLEDRPNTGHASFEAGCFYPIQNKPNPYSISGITQSGMPSGKGTAVMTVARESNGDHIAPSQSADIRFEMRSAYAIADELTAAYADKGLMEIPALFGVTDFESVNLFDKALFQPGLKYRQDSFLPEHPVPDLIRFERYLRTEGISAARILDEANPESTIKAVALVSDVLKSVAQGIKYCREVTGHAKQVVANKTTGYIHSFGAHHSRCFLALGEDVPSDIPFVAPSQNNQASGNDALLAVAAELKSRNGEAARINSLESELAETKDLLKEFLSKAAAATATTATTETIPEGVKDNGSEKGNDSEEIRGNSADQPASEREGGKTSGQNRTRGR